MTGLRRSELASLTSSSFDLDSEQPILTVAAGASKHRRKDVLPIHAELVPMIRDWVADLKPKLPLFPKLAKRRTWLMVKKDLERAGIPYETEEGIADFHAAGRHSHITGLLKSGVSVPHAMALARHTDVRMTMKYTHIGIDDQADALKSLPAVCQDIVRKPGVFPCPDKSPPDADCDKLQSDSKNVTLVSMAPCDVDRHKKTPPDSDGVKWRRRESNESARCRNHVVGKQVTKSPNALAGNRQETEGTAWLDLSSVDPMLCRIIEGWGSLPKHIRDVATLLCDDYRN